MKAMLIIEMPKNCTWCPFCDMRKTLEDVCLLNRNKGNIATSFEGRPDWCPLIPVPEETEGQ